jgi:SAM-dependent methyltransferase
LPNKVSTDKDVLKKEYDDFYSHQDFSKFPLSERALVRLVLKRYNLTGGRILDIGCGTGRYTELFRQSGLKAVGVDLSQEAIKIASEKFPDCLFISTDIMDMHDENDKYDLVFCHGFSPFLQKDMKLQEKLLGQIVNFLKPNGILFFGATSRLTDKISKSGSRWEYKVNSYMDLFNKIPDLKVIDKLTIFPHFFVLPEALTFSKNLSKISSLICNITGIPLRIYITLRRNN